MNEDFRDLLASLLAAEARFMVVGAHAMAVHGVPRRRATSTSGLRATRPTWRASGGDCLPPRRIDILTSISGVEFETAWPGRVTHRVGELDVPFIGRADLVRNKRASGRTKDQADLEALGETRRS